MHLNLNGLKTHTANGKRLTSNCSLQFAVNVDLKVSTIVSSLRNTVVKHTYGKKFKQSQVLFVETIRLVVSWQRNTNVPQILREKDHQYDCPKRGGK